MFFCETDNCPHFNKDARWHCEKNRNCVKCETCSCYYSPSELKEIKKENFKTTHQELQEEKEITKEFYEAKYDQGKPRFDLLDPIFEEEIAQILEFGARKYEANSWQTIPDPMNRYIAAMRRHLNAMQQGEYLDPDSGLPHHAHMSCNAMFISFFSRMKNELDRQLMGEKKK